MKELVFVHGRSQQNKDSRALKSEWIEAWAHGLRLNGLEVPIRESTIHFPYYGDALAQLVEHRSPDEVAEIVIRGDGIDDAEREFQLRVLREVQAKAGLTDAQVAAIAGEEVVQKGPLNWGWVRAILTGLDRHVPFGSGASIAMFTRDVYCYLKNPGVRDVIDEGVRRAIGNAPTVVVGHSLGSVVAYNVLRRDGAAGGWEVPLFATVGCPLGITAIRNWLRPLKHPECAGRWFNAMDGRDIVALYPLDAAHGWNISPPVENKTDVNNPTSNRHGIAGYLGDPVVAKRIYDALA